MVYNFIILPQVDLKQGAMGPEVTQLQDALVKLGYMTTEQVETGRGNFGQQTRQAVYKFQADNGIKPIGISAIPNGVFGPQTRAAMAAALSIDIVPQVDLRQGAEGWEVRQLQDALLRLGYMRAAQIATGPGIFGPQTRKAVLEFQAIHTIGTASGNFDSKTRKDMEAELERINIVPQVVLSHGAQGPEVRQLQDALVRLGFMTVAQVATGPGIFGLQTQQAVSRFQRQYKINTVSGNFDSKTRKMMEWALAGVTLMLKI